MKSFPELESGNQCSSLSPPAKQNKESEVDDGAGVTTAIEDTLHLGFSTLSQSSNLPSTTLSLGQSYLDFDGGFIGSHQQFLSEGYSHATEYQRRPSFLEHKWGVEDIDRYMVNVNGRPRRYYVLVYRIFLSILEVKLTPCLTSRIC